jgi:hypothetical protein
MSLVGGDPGVPMSHSIVARNPNSPTNQPQILQLPSPRIVVHNNLVSETMAGFYATGAHPWATSALFSAAPLGPPPVPHALSPEEVTQMLLEHSAAIRGIHEELTLLTGRPPPRRVRPSLPRQRQHSQCRPQDHSQWRRRRRCLPDRCPRQCDCRR